MATAKFGPMVYIVAQSRQSVPDMAEQRLSKQFLVDGVLQPQRLFNCNETRGDTETYSSKMGAE